MLKLYRMKMLVLPAILAAIASPAAAYDDPTVAVCEFTKFKGEDISRSGYTRLGATIDGHTVTIKYERSVLNIRPKPSELQCKFVYDGMAFKLQPSQLPSKTKCNALESELSKEGLDFDRRIELQTQYARRCQDIGRIEDQITDRWNAEIVAPLTQLGVYPIMPADTDMRP